MMPNPSAINQPTKAIRSPSSPYNRDRRAELATSAGRPDGGQIDSPCMVDRIWSSPTGPEDLKAFRLRGGRRGCLLVHGFAGTPPEMRDLAEHLAANGYDVMVPLLAGHGTTPQAMRATRWRDWVGGAEEALAALRQDCP